ncbi:hypothetical protein DPMN_148464 [Dreissena polymorpha]|uniref:Uncharacterized protein n=1 Tax=Dreissena polymorpha TaxID=45954 RepID=A0A9D4FBX6_DREPO|nr:hypothetical protein DPMN_148464 [Dreissena polymorpha]
MLSECTIQVRSSWKSVPCIIVVMNLVTERTVMRLQFMETHTCTSADVIFAVKIPLISSPVLQKGRVTFGPKCLDKSFQSCAGRCRIAVSASVAVKQMQTP